MVRSLINQARLLENAGDFDQAIPLYLQALQTTPGHPEVLGQLAMACLQQKNYQASITYGEQAIQQGCHDAHLAYTLGVAYLTLQHAEAALHYFAQAVLLNPDHVQALYQHGWLLHSQGESEHALADFDQILAHGHAWADVHICRGVILTDLGRFDEALASYDAALALEPHHAGVWNNRGSVLQKQKKQAQAMACFERAMALHPKHPGMYTNKGMALQEMQRPEEALAVYDEALSWYPDDLALLHNKISALYDLNRFEDALDCCAHAQKINPHHAPILCSEALIRLTLGEFITGWTLYENRWQAVLAPSYRNFQQPLWLGETSLVGKTILLHAEQGLGDTLQFCRYAPLIVAQGARVILEVQPSLLRLMRTLRGNCTLLARGKPLPAFDYQTPLLSLPLALHQYSPADFPANIPYLSSDSRVLPPTRQRRVGLAWSGSDHHEKDHYRSIPLKVLTSLLSLPFEFHVLQKVIRAEDQESLAHLPGLIRHDEELNDFADTAEWVMTMDLIISVDTALAHLAGALGKPVWVLLPFSADFRWLTDRSDSPWYPAARLFRQQQLCNWTHAIDEVRAALAER